MHRKEFNQCMTVGKRRETCIKKKAFNMYVTI
jgi:hypothetical protein